MPSKRTVLTTFGSLGDVHPYLAIAKELQSRGHTAVVATAESYRSLVEGAGLDFAPMRPDLPPPEKLSEEFARVMHPRGGTKYLFQNLVLPALRESHEDLTGVLQGADLLLTHTVATAGPIVAQKTGVPWVSAVASPIALYSRNDPPLLPILPSLSTLPMLGPLWTRALMQIVRKRFEPIFEPVAKLRAELGLPLGKHPLFEGQHSPTRVLALFSSVMAEPQPDWPPQTRITGFCTFDGSKRNHIDEKLSQFLDEGSPPIVFTLGASSVHDAGDFFAQSIDAVQQLKQRAILIGDKCPFPTNLPDNIAVFPYVPLSQVLPRCAAIVHHGGIGTIALALKAACPMLIMPHSHDQPDNAARIARHGVARIISRRQYQAARIAAELNQLLHDSSYSGRAAELQKQMGKEDGAHVAADYIEEQLAKR